MPRLLYDTVTRIDCTTLARIKALMGWTETDTPRDNLIESMIDAVSIRIEDYIGQPLASGTRTEEYDLRPRQAVLFLRVVPISTITTIKVATDWNFNEADALDATAYHCNTQTGEVWFTGELMEPRSDGLWPNYPMGCQVVYSAGLATDTATLITSYPSIVLAADMWVGELWRRKTEMTGKTKRVGESNFERVDELRMPKDVAETLSGYRRIRFGMA